MVIVLAFQLVALVVVIVCAISSSRNWRKVEENWRKAEENWERARKNWEEAAEHWERAAEARRHLRNIRKTTHG